MQPIYFALFELLQQFIYGLDTVLTPEMQLTLTILASTGSVFVVAVPFILVKNFFSRWF